MASSPGKPLDEEEGRIEAIDSQTVAEVPSGAMATEGSSQQQEQQCSHTSAAVCGGTQDPEKPCPPVPSQHHEQPEPQPEKEKAEKTIEKSVVPTVEDMTQKIDTTIQDVTVESSSVGENVKDPSAIEDVQNDPSTVGLPDLVIEDIRSDIKDNVSNSTMKDSEHKNLEVLEKINTVKETSRRECSNCGCELTDDSAQEESVLPSMGILPDTEGTPAKVSQTQESQSASSSTDERSSHPHPVDPSEVVHKIKKIKWQDIEVPIITQNNNGPCPLLAIVNVMTLKGQITLPTDRAEITGGELVLVVGNALFDQPRNSLPTEMKQHLEQNTEDAISMLHKLLTGLDVNVKFSGVRDFEFTGELCVFDLLGIMLYHGWVVDPSSEVAAVISELSYNQLTNNIFAWREDAVKNNNNDLLVKAMLCEEFMNNNGSQLTIHGLFELSSALAKEEIAVLFRNNHFSTIYKRGDQLYQLLTDQGFLHENMVWETLNDVDATFSEFVNGNFQPVTPTPEPAGTEGTENMTMQQQINSDQQLAAMLQHQVELQQRQQQSFERLKDSLGLHNLSDEEIAQKLQDEENRLAAEAEASATRQTAAPPPQTQPAPVPTSHVHEEKKKKDCVIL